MPKISIIVPVCNVEKYLSKCLDSIVNQTLKNIEIICVDDGSTDNSGAILDSYSQNDSRIKVIHKKNSGYGNSMNVGMDCAEGEYIGIVESDDCILPEMYEELYKAAKESNLDFVKSDAVFWWERIGYSYNVHYDYLQEYYDKVLMGNARHVFYKFLMNIWTGIYKRDFLKNHNIRFNETPGASYQDNGFWFQTMTFADRAMWIGKSYYMYRQDNPMASIKSEAKVLAMSNEYDYIEKILKDKNAGSDSVKECNYYRLAKNYGNYYRIADELKENFLSYVLKDYGKYGKDIMDEPYLIEWYRKIAENPIEFCKYTIDVKNSNKAVLEKAESIVIYGAGKRGQYILRHLYNIGVYDKITNFVVSDNAGMQCIGRIEVINISELADNEDDNMLVIISASNSCETYRAMESMLHQYKINNYIGSDDIINNFYSIC